MLKKMWVAAVAVFIGLLIIGLWNPRPAVQGNRSQEILDGCEREFGNDGIDRVRSCAVEIMLRERDERGREKTERAAR